MNKRPEDDELANGPDEATQEELEELAEDLEEPDSEEPDPA